MKNATWSGMCAAALLSATVAIYAQQPSGAAQAPTPSSPPSTAPASPPQPPSAATRDSANKITVTGCLQAASDGPTGTSGTAASTEKFVLTNVSSDPSNDAAGAGTTAGVHSYRLVANEQALAPHAGKKIEVTGTLDSQASASRGPSSAPSDSSASAADAPRLIVESGKVIAPTCTD